MQHNNIHASRIGKPAELLVAAVSIIGSRADLNASTSIVDDEGVDLVFHRRDGTATLAVQVKSRTTDTSPLTRGLFQTYVRRVALRPRADLDVLFVAIDPARGAIESAWLVPSTTLADRTTGPSGRIKFAASLKENANDQWRPHRLASHELPGALLRRIDDLERTAT